MVMGKGAVLALLKDQTVLSEELVEQVLLCARKHHLGIEPLARIAREFLEAENFETLCSMVE